MKIQYSCTVYRVFAWPPGGCVSVTCVTAGAIMSCRDVTATRNNK